MIRTQIQLTERQAKLLKEVAARRGVSISEVVRDAVDAIGSPGGEPSPEERRRRAVSAAGRFRSGRGDVSRLHDEHLVDAFEAR